MLEHGARVVLIRPAPVTTLYATRSMALPEFDPFWERVVEADIVVGMHASDSGYQRYINEWEGVPGGEMLPFKDGSGFAALSTIGHRAIEDTIAAVIGHGLPTRFPTIKILPVENGSHWVRPSIEHFNQAYELQPQLFEEHPVDVLKRNIWIHPFHEEDPKGLIDLVGCRPRVLRFRLPARRGHVRPDHLRRRPRGSPRGGQGQDHGRQPRRTHERRRPRVARHPAFRRRSGRG